MSEKGQKGMPMHYNADDATYYSASEPGQNEKCVNAKYLKYGLTVLIIFVVLDLFAFTYFTQRISEMRDEIKTLKREYQFDKWKRNGAAKEHDIEKNKNNSLRPSTEELERIRERVQKLQPNKTTNTTKAFQDIKDHLNFLISSLGRNLSADGSRVSRLRFELNATKNELTKAESNIDELWKRWNRTNAVVEDLTKLLAKQNETLHFKIAYHSDALYSEVKDVELKQTKFQNETNKILNELRSQLTTTRQNLEHRIDDKISRANKTWHRALEDSVKSARSSIEDINVKADGMKEELRKSIDNMKQQQNNLSKTKTEFQETHRKHDSEISDQVSKTDRLEDRIAKLESDTSQKNKIQHVELKQTKFHDETNKILNELRNQLKTTRQNLEQRLDDKKQYLQKSIDNIKTEFQEKQRKHNSAISDQVSKTGRLEDRIAKLESDTSQKNKIQHLENRVKEIENGVSGLSRTDIKRYIFVLFLGWLMYDLLN